MRNGHSQARIAPEAEHVMFMTSLSLLGAYLSWMNRAPHEVVFLARDGNENMCKNVEKGSG